LNEILDDNDRGEYSSDKESFCKDHHTKSLAHWQYIWKSWWF